MAEQELPSGAAKGGSQTLDLEPPTTRVSEPRSRFIRRYRRHKLAMFGTAVVLILIIAAIFSPIIGGQDPYEDNLRLIRKEPQAGHMLGTDGVGRDVWTRLVFGSRVSLAVGLVAVSIYTVIGLFLGSVAGYYGGNVDNIIMRFTDIILAFPTFLLILTVVSVVSPSIFNIMIIIGAFGWPGMCRLVRGQFLSLREQDFVMAARSVGVPSGKIMLRHMLPNVTGPVAVAATLGLAGAMLTEAGLSFLGLGVQVPQASWGNMLFGAMSISIIEKNWWLWFPPGFMISLAVLSINFIGDGLRDALDPRMTLD